MVKMKQKLRRYSGDDRIEGIVDRQMGVWLAHFEEVARLCLKCLDDAERLHRQTLALRKRRT